MIDHTAVRNRLGQWATFLYDMHGELTLFLTFGRRLGGASTGHGREADGRGDAQRPRVGDRDRVRRSQRGAVRGSNVLGWALMQARARLRAEAEARGR